MLDSNLFLEQNKILQSNIVEFQQKSAQYCQNFCIGSELEFYVFSSLSPLVSAQSEQLNIFLENVTNCKTEQGNGQLEVVFDYTDNFLALIAEIAKTKKHIYQLATQHNLWVSFAGKPINNDCGSALQFSLSCLPKNQQNGDFIDNFYVMMAVFLLDKTKQNLAMLNLYQQDYFRYCQKDNKYLFSQQKNTSPTHLSFGNNNRTCAVRLAKGETAKRLEYRVASASASPSLVLSFIFSALNFGLENYVISKENQFNSKKFGPIFGNSFDEQYQLVPILENLIAFKINIG